MTTCPEIASQNDPDIVLSAYERTNGTVVLIGCKGFGRQVSEPTSVVCLDSGAWSETPNLECKFGLSEKEKIIFAAALVSAALVLVTLVWICCYCCCCRRRRGRHWRHYKGWRGWRDNWKDGWSGWTSRWFGGSGDDSKIGRSHHFYDYSSSPSKTFVHEYGYSSGDKDKKNSFSKKSDFFRSSRRYSDGDMHSVDRKEFSKKTNFLRHSGKHSDADKKSLDRKDFLRSSNFYRRSEKFSDIDKRPVDRHDISKKSDFFRRTGKNSDMDKHSIDRQDLSKSSKFYQPEWRSDWRSELGGYYGYQHEGRREGLKGWRGWTDSLRDHWIDWRSRTFGDSPADGSVRRRDHFIDNSYPGRSSRQEFGRYSDGGRHEIVRSRRYSNDYMQSPGDRGRRYSDTSLLAQRRYAKRNVSHDSMPDEVNYHRVRRYSDPNVYRSEFMPRRQEATYESRVVPYNYSNKPSFNIIRTDEAPQHIIERTPTTFEFENRPTVHYGGTEVFRNLEPSAILEPLYYTDPHFYHVGSRQSGALYSGQSRYSGEALYGGQSLKHISGHGYTGEMLRLPPVSLEKLSKVVDIDLNRLNKSYGNRIVSSPKIIELDGERQKTSKLAGTGLGRTYSAHYEVLSANPSSGFIMGQQEFPSTKIDDHYTLYQGKGRKKEVFNNDTNPKIIY